MTITRLELTDFTVFEKANFEFCPGINVLIGENGTGKSHVLKAMYAMLSAWGSNLRGEEDADLELKLFNVFRPEDFRSLLRRKSLGSFRIKIVDQQNRQNQLDLKPDEDTLEHPDWTSVSHAEINKPKCIFVPPREVLAMYRGFVAAYEGRELDFDETYYDLCKALSAAPLRGARAEAVTSMLAPLEQILGGKVVLEGDRFLIKQAEGETEAHLAAEGLRKIASLAYLVANGALTQGSVLFWDEPEASLNPALVVKVVDFLRTLAASGVQVFLASHDFLLIHRLSQVVEYKVEPVVPVRFFSLFRSEPGAPVQVEQADTLVDIEHNAILDEFARYYDREQTLAAQAMRADASELPDVKPTSPKARAKKASTAKRPAKKQAKAPTRKAAKKQAKAPARTAAKKAARA